MLTAVKDFRAVSKMSFDWLTAGARLESNGSGAVAFACLACCAAPPVVSEPDVGGVFVLSDAQCAPEGAQTQLVQHWLNNSTTATCTSTTAACSPC